ncbi:MAG: GNAT family N-acetyltransferase [Ruminococcus sp.]|nr:GNAT family N-acetyltransferase [Ruminococcus sp.]
MEHQVRLFHYLTEESRKIRTEVFVNEQGFQEEFDEVDARAWHVIVLDGDKAVATGRVFSGIDGIYHIGRVAVLKEYRKMHVGRIVMTELEKKARELGAKCISLSAQCQASGFYEKIGYSLTEDLHLDQGCPHVTMIKVL